MAKVVTQSIPSEDRIIYKRALQISTSHKDVKYIRTRFPWRLPQMQEGGANVKAAQRIQRDRFKYAKNHYALLSASDKARWAAANPEYHSYLFGYNFFMLEGLMGGGPVQYPQMIKSIQVVKEEVPTTGNKSFTISEVDPAKCVVLIQGNSYISDTVQRHSGSVADDTETVIGLSPNVDPAITEVIVSGSGGFEDISEGSGSGKWGDFVCSYLSASQVKVKLAALPAGGTYDYHVELIEHKAQTIYPVLVSIAAEAVVIDWAKVPSVAADVSITVVEYL